MRSLNDEELLIAVDMIEGLMLQGVTLPHQIRSWLNNQIIKGGNEAYPNGRKPKCTVDEVEELIGMVHKRWQRHVRLDTLEERRSYAIEMLLHALREAYKTYTAASQLANDVRNVAERNRSLKTIVGILTTYADLQGLREHVVKIGGTGAPIQIESNVHAQAFVLESMINDGIIDNNTYSAINAAVREQLGLLPRPDSTDPHGTLGPGNLREVDAGSGSTATPSGNC